MATEDSFTYCDSDNEVYMGKKKTQKEIIKSTLLGQNYDSPIARPSTPKAGRSVSQTVTANSSHDANDECVDMKESKKSMASLSISSDDDVIVIDSDSIQIISDDDSFVESSNGRNGEYNSNKSDCSVENRLPDKGSETGSVNEVGNGFLDNDVSSLQHSFSTKPFKISKSDVSSKDSVENFPDLIKKEVQKIINSPKKTNDRNASQEFHSVSEEDKERENKSSTAYTIEALIEASIQLEEALASTTSNTTKINVSDYASANKVSDTTSLSNFDFSSLTGVSDSILNISHGSSLPSPGVNCTNKSSLGLLDSAIYEDISYEGDNQFDTAIERSSKHLGRNATVDLHMSVDETDNFRFETDHEQMTADVTRSTLYKTGLPDISSETFHTANNTENFLSSNQQSSSFSNYREANNESVLLEGVDITDIDEINEENKNETSFEMVLQNRQNSFASVGATSDRSGSEIVQDKPKPKFVSKLPVLSTVLKPSLLPSQIKPENLKRNFKWAKSLPKTETVIPRPCTTSAGKNTPKTLNKVFASKTPTPKLNSAIETKESGKKTPVKNVDKTLRAETKIPSALKTTKTPCKITLTPAKTPLNQGKMSENQAIKVSKSDSKTPNPQRLPVKRLMSSDKKGEKKNLLQDKDRYKDVISPVKAYIAGSPAVVQRKVHVPEQPCIVGLNSSVESNIPVSIKPKTPISAKYSKAVHKLNYGSASKAQDQENMDPNYPCSRDTLPQRIFQPATAVFMKEPEVPKRHLPKIGQSMQKLLDTPRPKVIIHQGRVKETPPAKGVLIPSVVVNTPGGHSHVEQEASRISVRVTKPAENTGN